MRKQKLKTYVVRVYEQVETVEVQATSLAEAENQVWEAKGEPTSGKFFRAYKKPEPSFFESSGKVGIPTSMIQEMQRSE